MSSSIYNEVDRFTNERHSTSIEIIDLPRLARVSNLSPVFRPSIKRNKRSDHLATRETAFYILFSAKTRIYKQNTYTKGVEKSLFQFSLRLLI